MARPKRRGGASVGRAALARLVRCAAPGGTGQPRDEAGAPVAACLASRGRNGYRRARTALPET